MVLICFPGLISSLQNSKWDAIGNVHPCRNEILKSGNAKGDYSLELNAIITSVGENSPSLRLLRPNGHRHIDALSSLTGTISSPRAEMRDHRTATPNQTKLPFEL